MSDYEYEDVVGVYRDRERVGYKFNMGTTIDIKGPGAARLIKLQKRIEREDPDFMVINQIENYFNDLKIHHYKFSDDELIVIIDMFKSLQNKEYKNPYAFILGYILYSNINTRNFIDTIRKIIIDTNQQSIHDTDVIRYYHLINTLQS